MAKRRVEWIVKRTLTTYKETYSLDTVVLGCGPTLAEAIADYKLSEKTIHECDKTLPAGVANRRLRERSN